MGISEVHNDPKRDVRIDRPFRGNIRCARLLITETGDFTGLVVAEHIRVAGRFDGSAFSKTFLGGRTSKVFGTVVTESGGLVIKGGNFQARCHTSVLNLDQFAPSNFELDAERKIEQRVSALTSRSSEFPKADAPKNDAHHVGVGHLAATKQVANTETKPAVLSEVKTPSPLPSIF